MAERHEKTCAHRLAVLEGEEFFAVGDLPLGQLLDDHFDENLRRGLMVPMPDLLSVKVDGNRRVYRLREVKFRLERRLVERAVRQLQSGLDALRRRFPDAVIDRLELVIALDGRTLKPWERDFLGTALGHDRYELLLDGERKQLTQGQDGPVVSVLIL